MSSPSMPASSAKKPIRPGLLIALLAMVAATAWSLLQDDEPEVRSAKGGRSKTATSASAKTADDASGLPAEARSLRSARAAAASGAPAAASNGASAALQGLSEQVARWQARGAFEPLGEAGNAAWASKLPPPPPPPRPGPPPPPPPPVAPPFPYQWVGRWQEPPPPAVQAASSGAASKPAARSLDLAVISGPNNTWVVKPGDVIEGQWRVDAVTETTVQVTYLPLSQTQTIFMRRT